MVNVSSVFSVFFISCKYQQILFAYKKRSWQHTLKKENETERQLKIIIIINSKYQGDNVEMFPMTLCILQYWLDLNNNVNHIDFYFVNEQDINTNQYVLEVYERWSLVHHEPLF